MWLPAAEHASKDEKKKKNPMSVMQAWYKPYDVLKYALQIISIDLFTVC